MGHKLLAENYVLSESDCDAFASWFRGLARGAHSERLAENLKELHKVILPNVIGAFDRGQCVVANADAG